MSVTILIVQAVKMFSFFKKNFLYSFSAVNCSPVCFWISGDLEKNVDFFNLVVI